MSAAPQRRRSVLLPLALGAVVAASAVLAALLLSGGSHERRPPARAGAATTQPSASASARGQSSGSSSAGSDVPDGFRRYTDPDVGWSVAVPDGWQAQRNGTETKFVDPAGGRYLLVDTRYPPAPSAKGAWEDQEKAFKQSHDGYDRITLENVDYRGYDAADWEFTYREGGATLHALDRGMVANGRGYALYFQTHDDKWDASKDVMHQIWDGFHPAS